MGGFVGDITSYIGIANQILIEQCYATGNVSNPNGLAGTQCHGHLGGFAGYGRGNFTGGNTTISQCYATGNVDCMGGTNGFGGDITGSGGFIGSAGRDIIIENCYATGNITENTYAGFIGGFIGFANRITGAISNCYSIGDVTSHSPTNSLASVGVFVGAANDNYFVSCFADEDVQTAGITDPVGINSATPPFGGLTGSLTCESTLTMQGKPLYSTAGWDFTTVWELCDCAISGEYPKLQFQNATDPACATAAIAFTCGGFGTATSPYLICTADDLALLAEDINCGAGTVGKYYKLNNDINISTFTGITPAGWFPIGSNTNPFAGNFDGNGHTIEGLWINDPTLVCAGLFGRIYNATIENLHVDASNILAQGRVGRLVGFIDHSDVTNCSAMGGTVTGTYRVGGFAGTMYGGAVTMCFAEGGKITATGLDPVNSTYGSTFAGGFTGLICETNVSLCYADNEVDGSNNEIGGFTGNANNAVIENCYAWGNVTGGNDYIGGFVGYTIDLTFFNYCYATGVVTAPGTKGGFIGRDDDDQAISTDCYYDVVHTSASGSGNGSLGATGKTTAELMQLITYPTWDFTPITGIWQLTCPDLQYPTFKWNTSALTGTPAISLDNTFAQPFPSTIACEGNHDLRIVTVGGCYTNHNVLVDIILSNPNVANYVELYYWPDTYTGAPLGPIDFDFVNNKYTYGPPTVGFPLLDTCAYFHIVNTGWAPTDMNFTVTIKLREVATDNIIDELLLPAMKLLKGLPTLTQSNYPATIDCDTETDFKVTVTANCFDNSMKDTALIYTITLDDPDIADYVALFYMENGAPLGPIPFTNGVAYFGPPAGFELHDVTTTFRIYNSIPLMFNKTFTVTIDLYIINDVTISGTEVAAITGNPIATLVMPAATIANNCFSITAEDVVIPSGGATDVLVATSKPTSFPVYVTDLTAVIEITGNPILKDVYHQTFGDMEFVYNPNTNITTCTIPNFVFISDTEVRIDQIYAWKTGVYPYTISLYYDGNFITSSSATLTVICPTTATDAWGDTFEIVDLAGHCWFKTNLDYDLYQNDYPIPFAKPYYHALNPNSAQYKIDFGLLYDYASVTSASPLCPEGYRLPTNAEWETLNIYSADELRDVNFWISPNTHTNTTGFSARPGGYYNGSLNRFEKLYDYAAFWSSDSSITTATVFGATMRWDCKQVEMVPFNRTDGLSVRCIQKSE